MRIRLFLLLLFPTSVWCQCNFSCTVSASATCSNNQGQLGYNYGATFNGGTPPYSFDLVIEGIHNVSTTSNSFITGSQGFGDGQGSSHFSITATDANGCTCSSGPVVSPNLVSRFDPNVMTRTVITNVPAQTHTYKIAYPNNQYMPFTYATPSGMTSLNYQLTRNGAAYASGNAQSKFVTDAGSNPRLEFAGLPAGSYVLSFSQGFGGTPNMLWCESGTTTSFFLPQAGDAGVNVQIGAGLAGPMSASGTMIDSLRAYGLLPLSEPYSAQGYVYTGTNPGSLTTASVLAVSGSQAVVDWVVVELRSPTTPYAVLASRPALIRRDGEVIDLDGDAYVNFPGLAGGSYSVALRHRNHLGVMTNAALSLGYIPVRANFRSGAAYGTSPQTLIGSVQCLWPGDCAPDGTIRYVGANNDRDPILSAIGGSVPTNVVSNVYSPMDVNMDGSIRYVGANNDRDIILQTVGGSVPTATRTQQLP